MQVSRATVTLPTITGRKELSIWEEEGGEEDPFRWKVNFMWCVFKSPPCPSAHTHTHVLLSL